MTTPILSDYDPEPLESWSRWRPIPARVSYCGNLDLVGVNGATGSFWSVGGQLCESLSCRDCAPPQVKAVLAHLARMFRDAETVWCAVVRWDERVRRNVMQRARRIGTNVVIVRTWDGWAYVFAGARLTGRAVPSGALVRAPLAYKLLRRCPLRSGVVKRWPSFSDGWMLRRPQHEKSNPDNIGLGKWSARLTDDRFEAAADRFEARFGFRPERSVPLPHGLPLHDWIDILRDEYGKRTNPGQS